MRARALILLTLTIVVSSYGQDLTAVNLQKQLNEQRALDLPAGVYLLDRTLVVPSGARVNGAGRGRTILKLLPGVNKDVVITERFAELAGTPSLDRAPADFEIAGLTIDGSYLEKSWNSNNNRVLNDSGSCLKLYGIRFKVDVEVFNCAENGLYTEGQGKRNGQEVSSTIRVHGTTFGKEALIFRGPGDIIIEHAVLGLSGITPKPQQFGPPPASRLFGGASVDGVVIDRTPPYEGSVEIGFLHIYGTWGGAGLRTRGNPRVQARHLISESNLGGVAISSGTWGGIGMLDVHSNGKTAPGRSAALAAPLDAISIDSVGPFYIAGGVINRTVGSGEDWTALLIRGSNNIANVSIRGNINPESGKLYRGAAVIIRGTGNLVTAAVARNPGDAIVVSGNRNRLVATVDNEANLCAIGLGNFVDVLGGSGSCHTSGSGMPSPSQR